MEQCTLYENAIAQLELDVERLHKLIKELLSKII